MVQKLIAFLLAVLIAAVPAFAEPAPKTLTSFFLSRSTDMPSRIYEVFMLGDRYYLNRHEGVSTQLDAGTVRALEKVLETYSVRAWDGFEEDNPDVLDGEMFSFHAAFSDGTEIRASGSNAFPDGYFDAAWAMEELLESQTDLPRSELAGTYRYEGGGFGGDFTVTLAEDGTYTFYEGLLSSYLGGGEWSMEGPYLYLTEENGYSLYFTFIPTEGLLTYQAWDSDSFLYVEVPEGGRFEKVNPADLAD